MTQYILAVYENGVLRPTTPLNLADGQTVRLAVGLPVTADEWEQRVRAAGSIREWVELANACPDPGPDLDTAQLLHDSRRETGFRVPDPAPPAGEPQ